MSADRAARLRALSDQSAFIEDDEGVISNGAQGAAVAVLGRDRLRLEVAGSAALLTAEPGVGAKGRASWLVGRPAQWSAGRAAGAPVDDAEWAAMLHCLQRAFAAVDETVRAAP